MAVRESLCHNAAQLSSNRGSRTKTVKALLFISFAAPGFPDSFGPSGQSFLQVVFRIPLLRGDSCRAGAFRFPARWLSVHRSEEHTSELQSQSNLVCRLLL